jgi:hypothetical protein
LLSLILVVAGWLAAFGADPDPKSTNTARRERQALVERRVRAARRRSAAE